MGVVRGRLTAWSILFAVLMGVLALVGPARFEFGGAPKQATPVLRAVNDDAGDGRATTTYDGPMVRRRTAIAIHPTAGADRRAIARQLRAAAAKERMGPLTDATFAVFSEQLLTYLVPELVVVLPEGRSLLDAEIIMKNRDYPTVGFYLVESVLVHDLTFAVIPSGVSAARAGKDIDAEGVLSDSLGRYQVKTQKSGLTIGYFGALLSDGQVQSVRESMARAAHVAVDRVFVEASVPTGGVDVSTEPVEQPHSAHHD